VNGPPSCAPKPLAPQPVAEPCELFVAHDVDELQISCRQETREQRCPAAERHRCDPDKDLVQQSTVGKLPHEVASADKPDVSVARRLRHLLVNRESIPWTIRMSAPGTSGSGLCVNTQHGVSP